MEDYRKPASKEWVAKNLSSFQSKDIYFHKDNKTVSVDITTLFQLILDHFNLQISKQPEKYILNINDELTKEE